MSQHRVAVEWKRGSTPFTYEEYSREHVWCFEDGPRVVASAAPDYLGAAGHVDPEQALVAAVSSCHMLAFLAVASRRRLAVEHYRDEAAGTVARNDKGQLVVARIDLRPVIRFGAQALERVDRAALRSLHDRAHRECFIANSVRSEINVDLSAQWNEPPSRVSEPMPAMDG